MGKKFGKFKYSIGDTITTHGRNLLIIDREYRQKIGYKNEKSYNINQKYYKYMCLNCGNEDWILEYSLSGNRHYGCNACCTPPRKVVKGVNDITTTAPWMVKYFKCGEDEAAQYMKYNNTKIEMVCPDCGRIHIKSPYLVYAAGTLSCPCSDGWSYPNKFMYTLLEQIGVNFRAEKHFEWSDGKIYDDYIEYNNLKIITEQHGIQHYKECGNLVRTLEEERENDLYKYNLAMENGIDYYFTINASESNMEYIKNSIILSVLLKLLNVDAENIDWNKCAEFATSNLAKNICVYKNENPEITLREIAKIFHVGYNTVLKCIKIGNKYGWCNYQMLDDYKMKLDKGQIDRGQKPVFCETNGMYYRTANDAAKHLTTDELSFRPRQIRTSISRGSKYFGYKFSFITQKQFNKVKSESPSKVVGDYFVIKNKEN